MQVFTNTINDVTSLVKNKIKKLSSDQWVQAISKFTQIKINL
jgi:hypothetical protein